MRFFFNILIIVIFVCALSSRSYAQSGDKKEDSLTVNSLMHLANESFEVISIELLEDTLVIVSTNDILFYPLGKYADFKEFQDKYLNKYVKDLKKTQSHGRIVSIQNENNFLRFIETDETERNDIPRLELVFANINSAEFSFTNGIKIGMTKKDLLLKIFATVPDKLENISVIKTESAVYGIWLYYIFSQENILRSIAIRTDYNL